MIEIEECGDCFSLIAKSAWFQHRQWHIDNGFPFGEDKQEGFNQMMNDINAIQDDVADLRTNSLRMGSKHVPIKKE